MSFETLCTTQFNCYLEAAVLTVTCKHCDTQIHNLLNGRCCGGLRVICDTIPTLPALVAASASKASSQISYTCISRAEECYEQEGELSPHLPQRNGRKNGVLMSTWNADGAPFP